MTKTDNRIYNRKTNRDLNIEMDLFILLKGKYLSVQGASFNDLPVEGVITDVKYTVNRNSNICLVTLLNKAEYPIKVKHGKPIFNDQMTISTK